LWHRARLQRHDLSAEIQKYLPSIEKEITTNLSLFSSKLELLFHVNWNTRYSDSNLRKVWSEVSKYRVRTAQNIVYGLCFICLFLVLKRESGSSGSIVSDYRLDDRAIGVRSPAGAKDFSSTLCVQTGSEAHLASCPMGTGGHFPGGKRGRGVMLTTHPHLMSRL
jgi:hypothetical protein